MASSSSPRTSQEIRKDIVFDRWVIFSPARAKRPSDFKSTKGSQSNPNRTSCAFCKNHEHECAPEIFRVPGDGPDWRIRVIQNLYPALSRTLTDPNPNQNSDDSGVHPVLRGVGFHDVVIETPDHAVNLSDLPATEIGDVILAYKERIKQLADNESVQYVQVFKNHGASAGASMSHSHSQLMGVPFVPTTVSARLDNAKENFSRTGKCLLCAIKLDDLLVEESTHFFSIVPFAASFPFEIWIVPREHASHFEEIDSERAVDLGHILKQMLLKLSKQLNDPPFNYMIHTSPLQMNADRLPHSHWFIQIVPQLVGVAGFEIATGCYINPIFPEDAAKVLREVTLPM